MKIKQEMKGFTIIEVLIVLAIAGLIMLVVFLAVPALQRNSRNTQRRNDISSYLGAVNEFVANNNGGIPTTAAHVATINGLANTGILTEPTAAPSTGAQSGAIGVDTFQLVTGARCDTATVGNSVAGSSRQIVLRFAVENSTGGAVPQCQEG
jgi:prepilin-type N-terminal cleavage/methylation domain-containing protein